MIASPDYHFDADKNNGIEYQEYSEDEVIEKVYSNSQYQDAPI